jgi:glycosyltransferase involved in cell wall biosynthesis
LSTGPFIPGFRRRAYTALAQAQGLIVYNEFLAARLSGINEHVHLIPSGVDSTLFTPNPRLIKPEIPSFLAVGRMDDPLKGFATVRLAAQLLAERGYAFQIFYTGGQEYPEPYLINIGWLNQEELSAWYQRVLAVVIPSLWWEPFGISALEGMASGIPIIASQVGGLLQIVEDRKQGLLVAPGNEHEMAQALEWIITHPDQARTLGQAGREKAEAHFTWERVAAKVASVLGIQYPGSA